VKQLPLSEGFRPDGVRIIVSGSLDSANHPSLERSLGLGDEVSFMAKGVVRKVTHARVGKEDDPEVERQHVIVLTSVRFDEAPVRNLHEVTDDDVEPVELSPEDAEWEDAPT
jgi:hypothetical protein